MQSKVKNIYTLDLRYPLLKAITLYLKEISKNPNDLSNHTVFLPTKRSSKILINTMYKLSEKKAILLPKIIPIGDTDEDEILSHDIKTDNDFDIKEAISPMERQFIFTQLVHQKLKTEGKSYAKSYLLAKELIKLIDQLNYENIPFSKINKLSCEKYSKYWQENLKFLELITKFWPQILKEKNKLDIIERKNLLLAKQAETLKNKKNSGKIIAAGSTASLPSTANLLSQISNLENGIVILPGLNTYLPKEIQTQIIEEDLQNHPDYGMLKFLNKNSTTLNEVKDFKTLLTQPTNKELGKNIPDASRAILTANLNLPANHIHTWHNLNLPKEAIKNLNILKTKTDQEEAKTIALIIRNAYENNEKILLITPNRTLAKMVRTELKKWDIDIDDSAGESAISSKPASLILSLTESILSDHSPFEFLNLIKHPLFKTSDKAKIIYTLDKKILRGIRPEPGLTGIKSRIETLRIHNDKKSELINFLENIETILSGLTRILKQSFLSLQEVINILISTIETLSPNINKDPKWPEIKEYLLNIQTDAENNIDEITPGEFKNLITQFLSSLTLRPKKEIEANLTILGPIEARLLKADTVIISSLNETSWPKETSTGPWLGRSMLDEIGLPRPERKIGLSAHDFNEFISSPKVYITRSEKTGGNLQIKSRFIEKLETIIEITGLNAHFKAQNKTNFINWQKKASVPKTFQSADRPKPNPPFSARPKALWATEIEKLMRDPYEIYAKKILKLKALDDIDKETNMADFGILIHSSLEEYTQKIYSSENPDFTILKDIMNKKAIRQIPLHLLTFWKPRIDKITNWFIEYEKTNHRKIKTSYSEKMGEYPIDKHLTIKAKADRINILTNNKLEIIDYKTGRLPTEKELKAGYSPQLPIEGIIAKSGNFEFMNKTNYEIENLIYLELGSDKAKKTGGFEYLFKDDINIILDAANKGVIKLALTYFNEKSSSPFIAHPHPAFAPKYSDYEHLSRTAEWG
jgi:ATP-dependent helicase/nuclease subunit B